MFINERMKLITMMTLLCSCYFVMTLRDWRILAGWGQDYLERMTAPGLAGWLVHDSIDN